MKERILEFLKSENKSSAQLAAEIGVQPSSISHILSGRNNPSLDFVLKMLEKYDYISAEWLLFGRGSMYSGGGEISSGDAEMNLFDDSGRKDIESEDDDGHDIVTDKRIPETGRSDKLIEIQRLSKGCVRIVCFYPDNTFREYFPGE